MTDTDLKNEVEERKPAQWLEVGCTVPAEMAEALADFLVELTECGVSTENIQVDAFSLDEILHSSLSEVKGYFIDDESFPDKLQQVRNFLLSTGASCTGFVYAEPQVKEVRQEDWATSWKTHFSTLVINEQIVVKPSWEQYTPSPDQIIIELDPGMAFGTGTHATTKLCLQCISQIFSHSPPFATVNRPIRVLDVGTGSGILAIAAAKLGAKIVVGIDIDLEAVNVAKENADLNGVQDSLQLSPTPLGQVPGDYDMVLANILAEDLVRMSSQLVQKVTAGGVLILSGILVEREPLVLEGFAKTGLQLVTVVHEGDWSCLVYGRSR